MVAWRPVKAFPNYEVSELGQMRRIGREACLKPISDSDGYMKVRPFQNGLGITKSLHRLIALEFLSNEAGKPEINHKNGDKKDNRVENLEWVTRGENNAHTRRVLGKMVGEQSPSAKLTDEIVRQIRLSRETNAELAIRFGVDRSIVCRIRLGQAWRHVR